MTASEGMNTTTMPGVCEPTDAYLQFLQRKIALASETGIEIDPSEVNPALFPHQRDVVVWAVRGGRRLIAEAFGLGKTPQQIEICRLVLQHCGYPDARGLIVLPLGVRQEFIRDAGWLGVPVRFVRTDAEIEAAAAGEDGIRLFLTNYESVREGKIRLRNPITGNPRFKVISLDEGDVLRSYGSKTYQEFREECRGTEFKFVATASPAPNRHKELIHYADFLEIMDSGQALTRFFQRDSEKAGNLTLYPHKEKEFWLWLSSWAVFLQRPSDLGYSDDGYDLPPLEVLWHEIPSAPTEPIVDRRDGQIALLRDSALSLSDCAAEKRDSMHARLAKVAEIIETTAPEANWLIWHNLETERAALPKYVPDIVCIYGEQDLDRREQEAMDFADGKIGRFGTKTEISGVGCNFQRHCHHSIYAGVNFKFRNWLQGMKRIHRFLQKFTCYVHIVYTEAERGVVAELRRKWEDHNRLTEEMSALIRENGLGTMRSHDALVRSIGVERQETRGEHFTVWHNDAVLEARNQRANSKHLILTSIPFANHYEYTPSYNDFGHTKNNAEFWEQMDFLTPELYRILEPGRICCIHVKDRILFGNVTGDGFPTSDLFHEETSFHFKKHGFRKVGMITVVTDVVRENNQTYRLSYTEMCKDGTKMGVGCPEYVLIFRKPQTDKAKGYADTPVVKDWARNGRIDDGEYSLARWQVDAAAFWRSSGNRLLTAREMADFGPDNLAKVFTEYSLGGIYDYGFHVRIGEELAAMGRLPTKFAALAPGSHHPDVWHDVVRMRTLNANQSQKGREQHVCLARGSLVLTDGGYKPIEQVNVGELVLTHRGRWRPVQAVRCTGVRPVVTMRAQGVPGLTLTPDHKVWTRVVPADAWSTAHSRAAAKRIEPDWVEADKTVGSYVNQKLPPVFSVEIPDRELWLIGRWIADGHVETRGGFVVSIGADKLQEFRQNAGHHAGGEVRRTATQIRLIKLSPVTKYVLRMCGSGAENKEIPVDLFSLDACQARTLLHGYLSGDGHYIPSRNRWTASTVSKKLALGLSMLAHRAYGAVASVYPGRAAGSTVIDGRTVNTKQDWVVCFDIPGTDRRKSLPFVMEDGAWKKVRSVDDSGEAETWCLRVEEDESFTAEGCIVKNCPLQLDIVNRLIERYTMRGETVCDPFAGIGTVPRQAVLLGRIGEGSELNGSYVADMVDYLRAAEEEISVPDLFSFAGIEIPTAPRMATARKEATADVA